MRTRRILADADQELRHAEELLTTAELCLRWKMTRETIAKIVSTGELVALHLTPRCTRYSLQAVRQYERQRMRPKSAE